MANVIPGIAAKGGTIPASAPGQDHHHGHSHGHAHSAGHVHAAPHDAVAIPRAYKHSMFLASAIERLVIAVLLIGLIWIGIFWAIS
ncbi:hypothetical protein OSH10_02170 [Kaistia defluvii]|uniref:hypothetical protein n=1 Tax=Kaistia defluvii TaxID=410841 RepID=UPI00224F3589|nr:hypothetical protein [Kaistia defluvii]MCX5517229.1 hypothetical protein [Kaistia defluvii]